MGFQPFGPGESVALVTLVNSGEKSDSVLEVYGNDGAYLQLPCRSFHALYSQVIGAVLFSRECDSGDHEITVRQLCDSLA